MPAPISTEDPPKPVGGDYGEQIDRHLDILLQHGTLIDWPEFSSKGSVKTLPLSVLCTLER